MASVSFANATVWEDSNPVFLARIRGQDGNYITQSSLSSITPYITLGSTITTLTALTISSVVFDTLQVDARWTVDTIGYNFRHTLPAIAFPTGDRIYRLEYKFVTSASEVFPVVTNIHVLGVNYS